MLIKGVQHKQSCICQRKFACVWTHIFAVNRAMSQILQLNLECAIVSLNDISGKLWNGWQRISQGRKKKGKKRERILNTHILQMKQGMILLCSEHNFSCEALQLVGGFHVTS